MPNWATVSLRQKLVEEIRNVLKTGRYRSISEFVSEAIRLRLEEVSRSQGHTDSLDPSGKTFKISVTPEMADSERQADILVGRLEQIWWVLVEFFEDLIRNDINVDVEIAPELRNCRTLINFIHAHNCPGCNKDIVNDKLQDLQRSLEEVRHDLITAALSFSESYAKDWVSKIDEAERGGVATITHVVSNFVPGLPKDPDKGWIRLTPLKPIANEKVQQISSRFGVTTEFEKDCQIIIKGEKESVKKAARILYRLQLE